VTKNQYDIYVLLLQCTFNPGYPPSCFVIFYYSNLKILMVKFVNPPHIPAIAPLHPTDFHIEGSWESLWHQWTPFSCPYTCSFSPNFTHHWRSM